MNGGSENCVLDRAATGRRGPRARAIVSPAPTWSEFYSFGRLPAIRCLICPAGSVNHSVRHSITGTLHPRALESHNRLGKSDGAGTLRSKARQSLVYVVAAWT